MKFFVIFFLFVALSVSAVAQENNDSANLEPIEGIEQAVLSTSSLFVEESNRFIETPYFPLLLGYSPLASWVVAAIPAAILGVGALATVFLIVALPAYRDAWDSATHFLPPIFDFSRNAMVFTLPIGLIASYIINLQYVYPTLFFGAPGFGEPGLSFFGFLGALLGEIVNTAAFVVTGGIWADFLTNSTIFDVDINDDQDFITVAGIVSGGLYLATSITRGIIASFQSEIGSNLTTGDLAKHWRVAPTISGIEAVYSY